MAINSGSEITVNAAGIVLMKDNLWDVINAIRISRSSFRRIKINFVWAFLYNILLIPIAMGVLYPANGFKLDPMWAGGAMAASSISVVLSSLMLKMFKPIYSYEQSSFFRKKVKGEYIGNLNTTTSSGGGVNSNGNNANDNGSANKN